MRKTPSTSRKTIRYREAAQWIQAMVTFAILFLIYIIQNQISVGGGKGPLSSVFDVHSSTPIVHQLPDSGLTALIFSDNETQVTFYPEGTMDMVLLHHSSNDPRSYTRRHDGIMVVEGNLSSSFIQSAVAFLDAQ